MYFLSELPVNVCVLGNSVARMKKAQAKDYIYVGTINTRYSEKVELFIGKPYLSIILLEGNFNTKRI